MQIEFRLLGQVEVWHDGRRLELGGRKQRAVLAALVVRAGRVVSLDQLIDDLWNGEAPLRAGAWAAAQLHHRIKTQNSRTAILLRVIRRIQPQFRPK